MSKEAVLAAVTLAGGATFVVHPHAAIGAAVGDFLSGEVALGKQLHPNAAGHRKMANWIRSGAVAVRIF